MNVSEDLVPTMIDFSFFFIDLSIVGSDVRYATLPTMFKVNEKFQIKTCSSFVFVEEQDD